jgi:phosphatidate cytidylyltransferase
MADGKPKKNADLPVRVASAVVMVLVAGTALWLGGWVWTLFVAAIGLGVVWEWWSLVRGFVSGTLARLIWLAGGIGYVGLAVTMLLMFRGSPTVGWAMLLVVLFGVIGTDIGAYFSGRTIGGPKIAPAISPSKTWAGLGGGMLGAGLGIFGAVNLAYSQPFIDAVNAASNAAGELPILGAGGQGPSLAGSLLAGAILAVIAQAGDFFESWMKRRAGVKDSGKLIPGHGGLFDRVDG